MSRRLGFTMQDSSQSERREHDVLVTSQPLRIDVSSSYKQEFCGCPFDTPLRPTSFEEGSDAYHAPRTSDEVLIEISTRGQDRGVEEYIGFLARHKAETPSKNGIREVKWIPRHHDHPVVEKDAARDLGPSRHDLLSNVYEAVDRWSRTSDSPRELGLLTNQVLSEYLGTMCHDITPVYEAVNHGVNLEVQPPSEAHKQVKPRHEGLVDHVKQECLQGRKAWYGAGQAEDQHR